MFNARLGKNPGLLFATAMVFGLGALAPAYARMWQDQTQTPQDEKKADKPAAKPKRPPIYDESADANEQIRNALAKAKRENRRVLIQWGGNWCGWCHRLHQLLKSNQEIAKTLSYEYDVVLVDVGQMDKNEDLLKKYDVDLKKNGVPFLTVLDADGKVVVNQETSSLETNDKDNPGHQPEAVLEFLTQHQAQPLDAQALLSEAMNQAANENRLVFLRFGAPWCGWCHRMDAWMAKPEIDAITSAAFVHVKIDIERMQHGDELLNEYCEKQGGIPWFTFIDPKTKEVIATSDGPKGNTGFPFEDYEIDHYCEMLGKCGGRVTSEQIATIKQSLNENRETTNAARTAALEAAKAAENGGQ